jgi:Ni,Fe-hydrogenase I cytochrome b subunit
MFDSLADRIREDEQIPAAQRFMKWTAILVIAIALFGGLYLGIQYLNV